VWGSAGRIGVIYADGATLANQLESGISQVRRRTRPGPHRRLSTVLPVHQPRARHSARCGRSARYRRYRHL